MYRRLELDCHSFYTLAELRDANSLINEETRTMLLFYVASDRVVILLLLLFPYYKYFADLA